MRKCFGWLKFTLLLSLLFLPITVGAQFSSDGPYSRPGNASGKMLLPPDHSSYIGGLLRIDRPQSEDISSPSRRPVKVFVNRRLFTAGEESPPWSDSFFCFHRVYEISLKGISHYALDLHYDTGGRQAGEEEKIYLFRGLKGKLKYLREIPIYGAYRLPSGGADFFYGDYDIVSDERQDSYGLDHFSMWLPRGKGSVSFAFGKCSYRLDHRGSLVKTSSKTYILIPGVWGPEKASRTIDHQFYPILDEVLGHVKARITPNDIDALSVQDGSIDGIREVQSYIINKLAARQPGP